jgi:hypothetical protein
LRLFCFKKNGGSKRRLRDCSGNTLWRSPKIAA